MCPFTRINPAAAGSACSICFGIGKPFGNVLTPESVTAVFSDIEKTAVWVPADGEPPNGVYRLAQDTPCRFFRNPPGAAIAFSWTGGGSFIVGGNIITPWFFFVGGDQCKLSFENQNDPALLPFAGGSLQINF